MLIQTESLAVVNTATTSFVPVMDANGNIDHYDAVTPSQRTLCTVTPRECEVILLMEATAAVTDTLYGKVLRTREWGVVNDSLNYRYSRVLAEKVTGSASDTIELVKWLHNKVKSSENETVENRIDILIMLDNLAKDHEFIDMTDEGRKIIRNLSLSHGESSEQVKKVLERWGAIFVDLPF